MGKYARCIQMHDMLTVFMEGMIKMDTPCLYELRFILISPSIVRNNESIVFIQESEHDILGCVFWLSSKSSTAKLDDFYSYSRVK